MASLVYRIGDYVFCEVNPSEPYQIRRIEDIVKTSNGIVETRVVCFYRRRDISSSLVGMADKQFSDDDNDVEEENDEDETNECLLGGGGVVVEQQTGSSGGGGNCCTGGGEMLELNEEQKFYLKHRELFLSRQVETLPATFIRGKCFVSLFNDSAETYASYLEKEDVFFYRLVYDPQHKSLSVDRGEVRIGPRYQADVPETILNTSPHDHHEDERVREELSWTPYGHDLTDKQIDQVMLIARSVGTFARALDCSGASVRSFDWGRTNGSSSSIYPGLHMSAAAASRDITLFHAMECIHKCGYDIGQALLMLVPSSGPALCRDELEDWSPSEAFLFEEALDKFGKEFDCVRRDVLPWKSMKSIIEYYYMWKTTDRYVQQRRFKNNNVLGESGEHHSKLKQVYIPPYTKQSPNIITDAQQCCCESCNVQTSKAWFSWNSSALCEQCWYYWKHYGGLKFQQKNTSESRSDRPAKSSGSAFKCTYDGCDREFRSKLYLMKHTGIAHGIFFLRQITSPKPHLMRTRNAFFLYTTPKTRAARRVCPYLRKRKFRRSFSQAVDLAVIQTEWKSKERDIRKILNDKSFLREKPNFDLIISNLYAANKASVPTDTQNFSISSPKQSFIPNEIRFPRPSEEFMKEFYERIVASSRLSNNNNNGSFEESNKRLKLLPRSSQNRSKYFRNVSGNTRNRFHPLANSFIDAADGVFFLITPYLRSMRKQISGKEIRRTARVPWKKIRLNAQEVVIIN